MRSRRQTSDESPSHDRWLVSYADFITLLFAFFVVMYATSSLNEGKYRVLTQALTAAFRHEPIVAPLPTSFVPLTRIPQRMPQRVADPVRVDPVRLQQEQKLKGLADDIAEALRPLVQTGQVRLMQTARGLAVEINAAVLFAPAQANLQSDSIAALEAVAQVLRTVENPVEVQGHTDRLPIANAQFPSNWELASARASAVIRLFMGSGVAADRLAAVGYADNRPVETDDTPEARARNRRVTLIILTDGATGSDRPLNPLVPTASR